MNICLKMIVKDEAHVIAGCFDSILPFISTWVICDTGSTDGTQDLIRDYFKEKNIPGELHERPWVNFGHNRTEAFQRAKNKADWILLMDADDVLHGTPDFGDLQNDAYLMRNGSPEAFTWWNTRFYRNGIDWRYVGVVHEHVDASTPFTVGKIPGDYYFEAGHRGSRSNDPDKYRKDALAIEVALRDEPTNSRYIFYLGQSWFSAGDFMRAREAYRRRVPLSGWAEEIFYAMYRIGQCELLLGNPEAMYGQMLLTYDRFPHRAEPLHYAAKYAMEHRNFKLGQELASIGSKIRLPKSDILFIEADVYEWRMIDVLAVCLSYTDNRYEARCLNERLLAIAPESERDRILSNLTFC